MMNLNDVKKLTEQDLEDIRTKALTKFIGMLFKHCLMSALTTAILMVIILKENSALLIGCLIVNIICLIGVFISYFSVEVETVDYEIEVLREMKKINFDVN